MSQHYRLIKNIFFIVQLKNKEVGLIIKDGKEEQTNYTYKRNSEEYKNLFNRAYNRFYTNEKFHKALEATNGSNVEHSIGKTKQSEAVLTKQEFCSRLM